MFKKIILLSALALAGCSTSQNAAFDASPLGVALRNLNATACANPAAAVANLPVLGLTTTQINQIATAYCATAFGTVAAPASAPGMAPIIPGPVTSPSAR